MKYDFLIVGAGLFGSVFAYEAKKKRKNILVVEKRSHIAGNIYTKNINNINVHVYGPHIFHTNKKYIWDYVNKFAVFYNFKNSPLAIYKNELFSLPFNMYTFNKMWGVISPEDAKKIIDSQKKEISRKPANLEEQAISMVGREIYEKLISGYTMKQWGKPCSELPTFIIKRLPVRFTYDNNYYDSLYQGVPKDGYTKIIENMLSGIEVILNLDYLKYKSELNKISDKVIYTGLIDSYFDYELGVLEYRSLYFEHETLNISNYQGNAVVNYTDYEIPWTRIIEHKWFDKNSVYNTSQTIISKEFSTNWEVGKEPFYPVNDDKNNLLFEQYKKLAYNDKKVVFSGRLGGYKYYDMDQVIMSALSLADRLL